MTTPFVSVLTPTYNRRKFIPHLLKYYREQTYPQDRMELIILDDGTDPVEDLVKTQGSDLNIRYIRLETKIPIGKKRNMLNELAKGDIMVCMDDDDYYPNNRVQYAVDRLQSSDANIAGSSMLYTYFVKENTIRVYGPYGTNHGTNNTYAYKREYLKDNKYLDDKKFAEEFHFTNGFRNKMVQLNPLSTLVCIAHSSNTFKKDIRKTKPINKDPVDILGQENVDFYKSVYQ